MTELNLGRVVGESAYELWVKQPENVGKTEQDFLNSLKPTSIPYGTITEFGGVTPPEGWIYTSGQTLEKAKFPHLENVLLPSEIPSDSRYFINKDDFRSYPDIDIEGVKYYKCSNQGATIVAIKRLIPPTETNRVNIRALWELFAQHNRPSYSAFMNSGVGTSDLWQDYVEFTIQEKCLLQKIEYNAASDSKKVELQVKSGNTWTTVEEIDLAGNTIQVEGSTVLKVYTLKNKILTNNFRITLHRDLEANAIMLCGIYMTRMKVDAMNYQIPNEQDSQGRFKIIYVGNSI